MIKSIIHIRNIYSKDTTFGKVNLEDEHFCYSLEDTVRAKGIKVYSFTAIPENTDGYNVSIRYSSKFKRNVLILSTEDDKETINKNGISFKYVYPHSGNNHEDTDGCILVAYNINLDSNSIYGSAEKDLFDIVEKWINEGYEVKWIIINSKQN